ncbi:MAG: hypothetical protein Q7K44_04120 [Candidatus Liptonbacteria bacterium]|nr:hypothetical protein [Candidatus Liptonbacteria bacterium]
MIILLYGPDEYRRLQKKNEIIAEFKKKRSGLGIGFFDLGEKDSFSAFQDFIKNRSMFETQKLAVLSNVFECPEKALSEELKWAAKQTEVTILVSEKNKTNENLAFLGRKSANIKTQDFPYLTGAKWEAVVSELAKENGAALQPEALKFLAEVYQNDTWGLVTEIQKVALLLKKNIELKDLEKLGLEVSPDFFGLLGGLKNQELNKRLVSLEKLFLLNAPMFKVFNMIAYQIPDKLPQLAKYDILVKSGKLDYEEALVDLII